jgi:hypothetical protein
MRVATYTIVCAVMLTTCASCKKENRPPQNPPPRPVTPVTKVAPPTPIQKKRVELGGTTWDSNWDAVVERALPPALLSTRVPRDVRTFCPRFYQLGEVDKRAFWAYFFQALAGAEAGLNPATDVQHTEPEVAKRDAVTGRMVRAEGLLQLTYEDETRYGCNFNWHTDRSLSVKNPAKTILQPQNNLLCGVKILTNQIIVQHKPLFSATSYWSTLRPGTESYAVFAKQMVNPPAVCGRKVHHPVPGSQPVWQARQVAGVDSGQQPQ